MNVFDVARSGLDAATRKLDTSASNIANAGSQGYQSKRVAQETAPVSGTETRAQSPDGGVDLATELVNQSIAAVTYKANAKTVQTAEDVAGALFDIKA